MNIKIIYATEFGSSSITMKIEELASWIKRYNFKILSIEEQQQGYSEEDMKDAYEQGARLALISQSDLALHKGKFPTPDEWFEQFKKK